MHEFLRFFIFPISFWVVGDGRGVLLDGLFFLLLLSSRFFCVYVFSSSASAVFFLHLFNMPRSSEFTCLFVLCSFFLEGQRIITELMRTQKEKEILESKDEREREEGGGFHLEEGEGRGGIIAMGNGMLVGF